MRRGTVCTDDLRYVPIEVFPAIKRYRIYKEDIFISVAGTLGIVGKVPAILDGANLTENANRITPKGCLQDYLLHVLMSPGIQGAIEAQRTVGAQPKLALARIRKFDIPLPATSSEQGAIADALSDADSLIASLEQLLAKKHHIKRGVMQEFLTGRRRLPGYSSGWVRTNIASVLTRISTGLNPRQNFRLNEGGSCYYVTIRNFSNGHLRLDDDCDLIDEAAFGRINERSDLRKGDILFSSIGRIGDVYLVPETPKNWNINESVFTLRPNKNRVAPLFLFHALMSDQVRSELEKGATGSTFTGVKQAHLKEIPIHMPSSLDEQLAVAEVLSHMDSEIDALKTKVETARQLKQGMMQELLTGRIRLV